MKLSDLVATPKLTKLTTDNEKVREKYKEDLDFYVMMPLMLDVCLKASSMQGKDLIANLVLTEEGKPLLSEEGTTIDPIAAVAVVEAFWIAMGK